ncbi:helix-turn-helix transcriptional regulator, partial [Rhizobium sp. BR5]
RLRWLGAVVGAEPFFPWTIDMLAACAAISESRLHALFIEEFGLPPHRWLTGLRMDKVCA